MSEFEKHKFGTFLQKIYLKHESLLRPISKQEILNLYLKNKLTLMPLNGKLPILKEYQKLSFNKHKILESFSEYPNSDNVGIVLKPSNLMVLDINIKEEDSSGFEYFMKLIEEHGVIDTCTILTGSGGLHLYFKIKEDNELNHRIKLPLGENNKKINIDLLLNNYVVSAGSIHPSTNKSYYILRGYSKNANKINTK